MRILVSLLLQHLQQHGKEGFLVLFFDLIDPSPLQLNQGSVPTLLHRPQSALSAGMQTSKKFPVTDRLDDVFARMMDEERKESWGPVDCLIAGEILKEQNPMLEM